jgi:hypothetical protein
MLQCIQNTLRCATYPLGLLRQASYVCIDSPTAAAVGTKILYNGTVLHFRCKGYSINSAKPLSDVVYSVAKYADELDITQFKYVVIERMHDEYIIFENKGSDSTRTLRIDTVQLKKDNSRVKSWPFL